MLEDELKKYKNIPCIVEGKKDKQALTACEFATIYLLKKPLFMVVEEIAQRHNTIMILTDLDAKGKELYGKLKQMFNRLGVNIDDRLRLYLFKETTLRQIEGLTQFLQSNNGHK